jgi:putative protein-disulfide isomerase
MPNVRVVYYTDPACPWSWAFEPVWRSLLRDLGESAAVSYVMCGMAREFEDPLHLVEQSLEAGAASGMPIDPRLWFGAAPRSSYPACIAVKAAAEQGEPGPYPRRLREGLMCRRRKLDTADALLAEARIVPGLDVERFEVDLGSHAILEAFGADLERGREATLPTLEFIAADGATRRLSGSASYEEVRDAARSAGAELPQDAAPDPMRALRRFGTMATPEVAAVCELPGPRAPAELWRLASEWRVKPERLGSGELWTLA